MDSGLNVISQTRFCRLQSSIAMDTTVLHGYSTDKEKRRRYRAACFAFPLQLALMHVETLTATSNEVHVWVDAWGV